MQTLAPTMSGSSSAVPSEVDGSVWRAVAGTAVKIPSLNSYVYYFPQGHLEQISSTSSDPIHNYDFALQRPWFPCRVLSVRFLSSPLSDQVFAKILLQPLQPMGPRPMINVENDDGNQSDVVAFSKVLTRSDANNGGGFSVPRLCADLVLPQLDLTADPPVQNLILTDTRNNAWEFRHIYRGTPRRHLLTTGWSKFVNAKRLVAGDCVVFMKKRSNNELYIGIRRGHRFVGDGGRDIGEAITAIENAVKGLPFEVVYYPRVGLPDFVVDAEKCKDALHMSWNAGMRVRMPVETEDSSRVTWIQGAVSGVTPPVTGPWRGSPWRMLQVTWDEDEISAGNLKRVSPWQVEYIPLTPLIDPDYNPCKKMKALEIPGMQSTYALAAGGHDSNSPVLVFNNYPVFPPLGIQGTRRDRLSISTQHGDPPHQTAAELSKMDNEPETNTVLTALSIGSSYSDSVSPVSPSSSIDLGGAGPRPTSASVSFQLFGTTIDLSALVEGGSGHNSGGGGGDRKCT